MTAAIIDTENIGTDLLIKLQRSGVIAQEAGVRYIDGSLCALGAGAGNSPTEVLAAVFDRLGVDTDRTSLVSSTPRRSSRPTSYAGPRWTAMPSSRVGQASTTHSSFLTERAAERYDVLRRCGELGYVDGQGDMIIDVALDLARMRGPDEDAHTWSAPAKGALVVEGDPDRICRIPHRARMAS